MLILVHILPNFSNIFNMEMYADFLIVNCLQLKEWIKKMKMMIDYYMIGTENIFII